MSGHDRTLAGQVAIVTGAAGGLGKATAKALAAEGATVVLADLDQAEAATAAQEIGRGAVGHGLDVTDLAAFTRLLDAVERQHGRIDVLVNNAGILTAGAFELEPESSTARELAVNLHAVIHGTKEAARRMKPRRSGHIVNVASAAGLIAAGGGATYCATKFGVVGYSEAASLELRGTGVEVSIVAPAVIKTQMGAALKEPRGLRAVHPEEVAAAIIACLERPRFAVFVPGRVGMMAWSLSLLPYRLRHHLLGLTGMDKAGLDIDPVQRAAYEARLQERRRRTGGMPPPAESDPAATAPESPAGGRR